MPLSMKKYKETEKGIGRFAPIPFYRQNRPAAILVP